MVTPTYYVYFTSTTIITSAVLFQGFKGTASSITTVVMGFLTICSGVVLLQLSKSAKDVPDTAVFKGDLDQIHTIAEQEQSETEPKADAIRGAAAIVRRFSTARQKWEAEELKRLHEEKELERLETLNEEAPAEYEWDGLRRRRTMTMSTRSRRTVSPGPFNQPPHGITFQEPPSTPHPPLGMSHFPTDSELEEERTRQMSPGILSSFAGTIRSRGRSIGARSTGGRSAVLPGHPEYAEEEYYNTKTQNSMHPVQLTDITVPNKEGSPYSTTQEHVYGLPDGLRKQNTEYGGAAALARSAANVASGSAGQRIHFNEGRPASSQHSLAPPTPPPHLEGSSARRQFSFQNVFRRHHADGPQEHDRHQPAMKSPSRSGVRSRGYSSPQTKGASEEERLGLVKDDSRRQPTLNRYNEEMYLEENDEERYSDDKQGERYGRGLTDRHDSDSSEDRVSEMADYEASRRRWNDDRGGRRDRDSQPRLPPQARGGGNSYR